MPIEISTSLQVVLDHVPGQTCTVHTGAESIEDGTDEGPDVLQSADHLSTAALDCNLAVSWVHRKDRPWTSPSRHVLSVEGPVDLYHIADVEAALAGRCRACPEGVVDAGDGGGLDSRP